MATVTQYDGDVLIRGNLRVTDEAALPDGTVDNDMVAAGAGIEQTKLQHQHRICYGQSGNATAVTIPVYMCYGTTGTILAIEAGSITVGTGSSEVTVDLKKNGTTCLTAPIALDSGNEARVGEAGTLSVTSLADGDLLELVVTASAGDGAVGTGLFVSVTVAEDAE